MAWASFSVSEGLSTLFPSASNTSTLFKSSSSSNLMSKVAPLVPPYWKVREPDTVLTGISAPMSNLSPVMEPAPVKGVFTPDMV